MNHFAKLKFLLTKNRPVQQFVSKLIESKLQDQQYLSLLLAQTVQMNIINFEQYMKVLVKFGANINYNGKKGNKSILMIACSNGNFNIVKQILQNSQVNLYLRDINNYSALFYAISAGNIEERLKIIDLMLQKSPQLLYSTAKNNINVVFLAVQNQQSKLLQHLLKVGAQINQTLQNSGNTPLHQAVKLYEHTKTQNAKQIIQLLIKYGASLTIPNQQGITPFDIINKSKLLINIHLQNQQNQQSQQSDQSEDYICQQQQFQQNVNFDNICKQIYEHQKKCQQIRQKTWILIEPFYKTLVKISQSFNLRVQLVGSYSTGLWFNYNDIDFILTPHHNQPYEPGLLLKIFQTIKTHKKQLQIKQITVHNDSKFSTIKVIMDRQLNFLKIDIGIFRKDNSCSTYASSITTTLSYYPQIKPVFLYIKQILSSFQLHDAKTRGLKTYALFLMVLNLTQCYGGCNVGQILLYFMHYYGFVYQFDYQINEENKLDMKINLFDPLNNKNNVGGKNTNVAKLQMVFRAIYYSLHRKKNKNILQYLLKLHTIYD